MILKLYLICNNCKEFIRIINTDNLFDLIILEDSRDEESIFFETVPDHDVYDINKSEYYQ